MNQQVMVDRMLRVLERFTQRLERSIIGKGNPHHDRLGRFASGGGAAMAPDTGGSYGGGGGGRSSSDKKPPKDPDEILRSLRATLSDETAQQLAFETIEKKGFTYDPIHKTSPETGYSVSFYKERELIIKPEDVNARVIDDYVAANAKILEKDPLAKIGGWFVEADFTDDFGKTYKRGVYLDVIHLFDSEDDALDQAESIGDAGVFNLGTKETVLVADRKKPKKKSKKAKNKNPKIVFFAFDPKAPSEEVAKGIQDMIKKHDGE